MSEIIRTSGCIRPVVASDTIDVEKINALWPRALLVTTATAAKITDASGMDVADVPLIAGYNQIAIRRVWVTGTATTAGIFLLY